MQDQRTTATFVGTRSDVLQHASGCARGGGRGREGEATTGAPVAGVKLAFVCVMPSTPSHFCTQQQNFGALKWTTGGWGSRGAPRVRRATTPCFQHGHKLRNATTPQGPRWREGKGRRQGCGGDLIVHSQPNLSPRKHMCREGNRRLCLYTPNRGRGVETGGRTAPRKNGISSDLTFCARGVGCGRRRGPERRGRARGVMRLRDVRDAAGVLFHDATLTTHRMYSGCL
jgi:hypothetical protein